MYDGKGLEDLGVPDDDIARILGGPQVVAEGNWCLVCQFLEDVEDVQNNRCMSCGCDGGSHIKVKVMSA